MKRESLSRKNPIKLKIIVKEHRKIILLKKNKVKIRPKRMTAG